MKRILLTLSLALMGLVALAQNNTVKIHEDATDQPIIPKEIYGQFSEHLGRCIYDGLWDGKNYRQDVLNALKDLKVPVLRWPGGCFADEYHWRDGIGPQSGRPRMINSNWGGTVEDNSFGTHEFLNMCEELGIEPYISGNVGSGTVEELAKWVEYMTAEEGTMADLRKSNGRDKPWKVKYLGIGNESWGCGGCMHVNYYADVYRRYQVYCRDYDGNHLYKIASGASDYDYNWTKVMMEQAKSRMNGLSLHYYTVIDWGKKGAALGFSKSEYENILGKAVEVETVLDKHEAIMDEYDPDRKVALILDEWGTWFDVEPGTNPGHLYQQNTMRDAMVAALSLNIFNGHTKRLKMANIAQIVNVLQSMILTQGDEIVLTPTYHVFRMYTPFQDATYVPVDYSSKDVKSPSGRPYPTISVSAARSEDGVLHVALVNTSVEDENVLNLDFDSITFSGKTAKSASKNSVKVSGEILRGPGKKMDSVLAYNDFGGKNNVVAPAEFTGFRNSAGSLRVTLPAASIVVLNIEY